MLALLHQVFSELLLLDQGVLVQFLVEDVGQIE